MWASGVCRMRSKASCCSGHWKRASGPNMAVTTLRPAPGPAGGGVVCVATVSPESASAAAAWKGKGSNGGNDVRGRRTAWNVQKSR